MKKVIQLITVLALLGCGNNGTGSYNGENYSFNLSVKNSSGDPIPNTEFKVRYIIPNIDEGILQSRATTTILVDIMQESFNSLFIYDLEGEVIDTLLYGAFDASNHPITYSCCSGDTSYKAGVKVYKYVLRATSTASDYLLFTDTKYMVMIIGALDYNQLSSAGVTDENGNFESSNKLWFPTLYSLPAIGSRDIIANDLGDFSLSELVSDSIEILVELDESIYSHKHHLIDGLNAIEMVITDPVSSSSTNPSSSQAPTIMRNANFILATPNSNSNRSEPPLSFFMSQNFPNPFN